MSIWWVTGLLAAASLVLSIAAFASRWTRMQRLPLAQDRSMPKGPASRGIFYAFTMGMAPWAKESTRIHWLAYLRGIAFHIGTFAGLAVLLASPWLEQVPLLLRALFALVTAQGALMGVAGGIMRLAERNLRAISTPDDHVAVWLVALYLAVSTIALIAPPLTPIMWLVSAVMLVYAPLGKIKHCIYFYFGRLFYGLHIGRRGIVKGLEASHGR